MSNTFFIPVTFNEDLTQITKIYCDYVKYLVEFLRPIDFEMLNLLSKSFLKVKPKLRSVLKPARQNACLSREFCKLAERRVLMLLRTFCIEIKRNFVKYNKEVESLLLKSSPPLFTNKLDLDRRVTKIYRDHMQVLFNTQRIDIILKRNLPINSQPLYVDVEKNLVLFLVLEACNGHRTQSDVRSYDLTSQLSISDSSQEIKTNSTKGAVSDGSY